MVVNEATRGPMQPSCLFLMSLLTGLVEMSFLAITVQPACSMSLSTVQFSTSYYSAGQCIQW